MQPKLRGKKNVFKQINIYIYITFWKKNTKSIWLFKCYCLVFKLPASFILFLEKV